MLLPVSSMLQIKHIVKHKITFLLKVFLWHDCKASVLFREKIVHSDCGKDVFAKWKNECYIIVKG